MINLGQATCTFSSAKCTYDSIGLKQTERHACLFREHSIGTCNQNQRTGETYMWHYVTRLCYTVIYSRYLKKSAFLPVQFLRRLLPPKPTPARATVSRVWWLPKPMHRGSCNFTASCKPLMSWATLEITIITSSKKIFALNYGRNFMEQTLSIMIVNKSYPLSLLHLIREPNKV